MKTIKHRTGISVIILPFTFSFISSPQTNRPVYLYCKIQLYSMFNEFLFTSNKPNTKYSLLLLSLNGFIFFLL